MRHRLGVVRCSSLNSASLVTTHPLRSPVLLAGEGGRMAGTGSQVSRRELMGWGPLAHGARRWPVAGTQFACVRGHKQAARTGGRDAHTCELRMCMQATRMHAGCACVCAHLLYSGHSSLMSAWDGASSGSHSTAMHSCILRGVSRRTRCMHGLRAGRALTAMRSSPCPCAPPRCAAPQRRAAPHSWPLPQPPPLTCAAGP